MTHSGRGTQIPQTLTVPFHVGEFVEGFYRPAGSRSIQPELAAGTSQERMIALFREVAEEVERSGASLVYAADCMAPLGVLAGLHRRGVSPCVVWLDAHGDFNTWDTTPSGYIGGMPVAMLTGRGEQTIVEALGLPVIDEARFLISDARDLDPGEGVALARSRVRVVPAEKIAQEIPPDLPIYVHLDVDVVTPSEMPALRFPAKGGPSLAAVESSLRSLARMGRVVCTTVACTWDPGSSGANAAAAATERLVAALRERV